MYLPSGCIGVGGGPYSLLLPRSVDFSTFWQDMQSVYHDPVDLIFLLSALQVGAVCDVFFVLSCRVYAVLLMRLERFSL